MGREIRRVPPNWKHPTQEGRSDGRLQPMFDRTFADAALESIGAPEQHRLIDWHAEDAERIDAMEILAIDAGSVFISSGVYGGFGIRRAYDRREIGNGETLREAIDTAKLNNDAGSMVRHADPASLPAIQPATREWIPVGERLPDVGEWVSVLVDRNEGDYFARRDRPRYSVSPATLVSVDSEGNGTWHRGTLASGCPLDVINYVTHWMPLPPPPAEPK